MLEKGNAQLKADMMLVMVTLGWGVSYFMMDLCLEEMDPFTLNAYRFLGAFLVAWLLCAKRLIKVNRQTLKYAFLVSIALVFVYIGATFGVKYTTQSNAGFLCATTTIFAPMFTFLFRKVVPERKLFLVIIMCTVGMGLMVLDSSLHVAKGDLLCLMCGVTYGLDLVITEIGVTRDDVDGFQLGAYQLGFTGTWMLILALIFETPVLPQSTGCWVSVAFLAIFCTGIAFILQPIAQQYTTATHVGVIFTLEPVFAAIVAFLFAGERLLPRAYLGMAIMFISIIIMEVDFRALIKGKKASD